MDATPGPAAATPLIQIRNVARRYVRGVDEVHALEHVSLDIPAGHFVGFMGPSGSGKSTLLNLVSGIDRPTEGDVIVAGQRLNDLSEDELARWRARHVGLIFQFFNLIPVLSARDNVALPLLLTKLDKAERVRRAETALRVVGLEDRLDHYPRTLSGGEQQRVAIARAIVTDPDLIVADEPTGDLDARNAEAVLDAFLNNIASNTRISVHNKAGLVYAMPYAFTRKVRQIDGVAAACAFVWFGGAFEEAGRVTFPNFAVEADQVGAVYPDYDVPAQQLADFQRYRDGAIVGRATMRRYGWKIGDRITLRSTVWPVNLDFRIVGEIPNDRSPLLWMNRDYLDEALKAKGRPAGLGIAGIIWVRAADPERVNAIMRTVDELSRNSDSETASETEKSFFSNFFGSLKGFIAIILLVTGLVALCIVFIAANTASMGVRERAGELAILKAIGFGRRLVFATLLAEATVLASVAGLAGVVSTIGITKVLHVFAGWNASLGPP